MRRNAEQELILRYEAQRTDFLTVLKTTMSKNGGIYENLVCKLEKERGEEDATRPVSQKGVPRQAVETNATDAGNRVIYVQGDTVETVEETTTMDNRGDQLKNKQEYERE